MRFSCFRFAPNEFWKNILGLLGLFAARRILPPRTDRVPGNIHLHTAHKLRFEYFRDTWCWVSMTSVIRDVKCPWLHLFAFVRKRSRQACKLLFITTERPRVARRPPIELAGKGSIIPHAKHWEKILPSECFYLSVEMTRHPLLRRTYMLWSLPASEENLLSPGRSRMVRASDEAHLLFSCFLSDKT